MRTPRLALLLGALAALLLVSYVAEFATVSRQDIGRSDFTGSYVGALLLREGHGARLYDETLQAPLHTALIAPDTEGNLPFVSPPTVALLAVPLTALDLTAAYRLFALVQLAMLAAAVAIAVRAAPWPARTARGVRAATGLAALAGTGTLSLLLLGQWDGAGALGLALGYAAWRRGHRTAAGLALALAAGVAKPHLALGLAALVIARRDRRLLSGAAAGVVGLGAVALLAVGVQGTGGFVHAALDSTHRWDASTFLGFTGLFGSWLGDGAVTQVLATAGSVVAVSGCVLLGNAWRRDELLLEPAFAGATALSLLAAPHLLGHDLTMLAPAAVAAVAWATARDGAEPAWPGRAAQRVVGLWLLLVLVARLDLGNGGVGPPGRLVPWGLLIAGGAAVAVCVRRAPRPAGAPGVLASAGASAP